MRTEFETWELRGVKPGFWVKIKVVGVEFLHFVQVFGQVVLASQLVHAWEMVDFLVRL